MATPEVYFFITLDLLNIKLNNLVYGSRNIKLYFIPK